MTIRVAGLRDGEGNPIPVLPRARRIVEYGTAFGVASGGWLASAGHVVRPDDLTIARLVRQNDLAYREQPHADDSAIDDWVARVGARPVGTLITRTVRRADPGGGALAPPPVAVRRVRVGTEADLALIQVDADGAPALELDEATPLGLPVATLGYGRAMGTASPQADPLTPAVRRGELARSGVLTRLPRPRRVLAITVPVERGDSGGPVVDSDGRVRGVVIERTSQGGYAERATEVRRLMEEAGVVAGSSPSAEAFRAAMTAFWNLDLEAARAGFADTLIADPDHPLARVEDARAVALAAAPRRLAGERRDPFLTALAVTAVLAALACGAGLVRAGSRRRPPSGSGR